ncbi:MAG: hypothetical protein KKG21_00705 [Candidatus Omnitrophica bacterium]|nr:hypothetical protein [Candidatus Omnitrophota bacterium]
MKYKTDEYDPKNLSHVNTFFSMLQYSTEIAQEDVSYVRPLESIAAERGKDDATMLTEKEKKAVAHDLVELYSMHKEALSVFNNRQNVPIDEKSREARLARLYEAFFILERLKKIYDTLSEEDSTIRKVLDHAIVQAKRFSKESFLYLADGSTPLSIIPFKQLTRFKDLRIDARHHHIALHPMMYLTDGISLSEVENPPLHAQNNHNHNDGEMTIALSGNIRVVEVNPHGEIEYTVPVGSIIKIPPKKLHRLTNPNEFSTTDFTLKDPFIALQKGFTDAGASPFEHIEIISPVIEMLSDGRGKVLTHYYPAIAHELRINEEQQLVLDDNNLPVVQAETYVKVSVVYINPGQSSDVFGINPIYPGFQTVRIFPWSEKIEPGWDMDERIKELKGEITLIDAAGKELRTDKVSGGDIVILNKGERDAASGFRIKNTGNAQTLVFAVIQEMQQEERLSEEFLERITLSELFKNIYDLWKDGQLELKGKTLETVKSIIVQKIPDAWHDTEAIIEYVDTFRDELTDKDRDLVALLLGSKDLIVEESKHDHAEPAFEPLPEQKRRTRKAGKEVTTTTEDMVRNNLLEMISAVSFASEQPATDSDAQLFECGGGYIGILPNNVIVVEGDDKEAVLNETYRMVIKLNAKGVSNSLDVIGYERSELDSEGSKKEKKIVRVFIRTTDQEPKFLIEDVMRLKMSRLNEYGPIISPANTGKETKDRYVREIDELRKEEFQDSNGDARNKMKPINPKDIKLSPYSRSEREEYLEAIKKVLNESDEKIANPEILKRAAEIALKGKQSSIEGKMGLQGGTFNPLTYGHITASLGGMISEELNGVVIANGGTIPDKPFASSAEIRNAMAELAVSGDQDLKDKIFVSDIRDAVVRMFEEGNAQDIAGENEDQRRFNMDMAAYIWLFMANPDMRWTFMVGSDKVNDYGRKDERNLVKTFKDNNIEVMYFERKGQEVDVDRNIMSYRWLSGFWQQGLFKKSRVSSSSALAASKARAALYAQEPQIEGMDLGEAISPAILEFINGEGQMTLRLIYKLDNIDREITKHLKEFNYSEAINQSSESLREIKELRKKGIRPSEAQLINALEERLKSKIASLKDFGITSFRAAEELIRQASVSQGSVRLAIEMYKITVDIYKNFEKADTRRIFKLASSRLKRLEKSLDDFKEEFDIVDENGRNVGVATRAETHALGLRHKNVNVMVFSHDGKKFLGQIRAKSKDVFGGALSNGAAGHVERGVGSKETALKEGGEEIATKDQSKKLDFVPERLKLIGEEYEHAGYLQMYEFSWLNEEEKQKVLAVIERELSAQEGDKTGQVLHTVSDELSTVYLFTYNRYQREDLGKIVDSVVRSTGIRPGMSMDNQEMKSLYVYQLDGQEERTVNEIMFELRGSQDIEIDLAKGLGEVVGLVWVDFDELITRFNAHPEHYTDAFAPFLKDEGIIAQIKESLKRLNPIDLDSTIENLAIQRTSI